VKSNHKFIIGTGKGRRIA